MLETTAAVLHLGRSWCWSVEFADEITAAWQEDRRFEPEEGSDTESLIAKWNRAVAKVSVKNACLKLRKGTPSRS